MSPRSAGYTLVELLFATTLAAIVAGFAIPQFLAGLDRSRAWAGARYLAARMALARTYAVTRSAHVALRFDQSRSDVTFQTFVDTNYNGVRSSDIASAVDRPIDAPVQLSELFPGVVIGAADSADPVRIGSSNLLSFSPLGTATSGSIYVRGRDGLQLAIRVLGATGRTRLQRYVPQTGEWVDSF